MYQSKEKNDLNSTQENKITYMQVISLDFNDRDKYIRKQVWYYYIIQLLKYDNYSFVLLILQLFLTKTMQK